LIRSRATWRLARRLSVLCTALVAVIAMAACGSSSPDAEGARTSKEGDALAFQGCGPDGVAAHVGGFLDAVSGRRRAAALGYIARPADFLELTLYDWARPGGGRVDSMTPAALYAVLAAAIPGGQGTALLAVEVGDFGPFAATYADKAGRGPTAGVQIAARIGRNISLSGKFGIDCDDGRIYAGAMNTSRGLRPQTSCGKPVRLEAKAPVVCRI
jgi:hypothetical protein